MTLRVKQAFCKVNNKIQQLRGEIKLSLPCCLFLNNPTFHPFIGLEKGKRDRKALEETEKITKKLEVQNNLPTFAPVFHQRT